MEFDEYNEKTVIRVNHDTYSKLITGFDYATDVNMQHVFIHVCDRLKEYGFRGNNFRFRFMMSSLLKPILHEKYNEVIKEMNKFIGTGSVESLYLEMADEPGKLFDVTINAPTDDLFYILLKSREDIFAAREYILTKEFKAKYINQTGLTYQGKPINEESMQIVTQTIFDVLTEYHANISSAYRILFLSKINYPTGDK